MPEWLAVALLTFAGVALTAVGVTFGHLVSARAQKRAAEVQADATAVLSENSLIDQLQEELRSHREAQDARSTAQDARMNRLETYSDGYRNHAHELRAHIWDGKSPPPPEWPAHLPR